MITYLLNGIIDYPLKGYILNYGIYYPLIFLGILVGILGIYKRLVHLGYDKVKVRKLLIVILIITYPTAIISAKAANMFYFPISRWGFRFFFEQMISGKFITFHGGIFLPLAIISSIILLLKMKYLETMDAFFLYIPLGHAIGRVACLLVGCCWGNKLTCSILGHQFAFENPIPLYSIIANLLIFFVAKLTWENICYPANKRHFSGLIICIYLIFYGNYRLMIELFRVELVLEIGLTQAQAVMVFFITVGSILLLWILKKNKFDDTMSYIHEDKKIYTISIIIFSFVFLNLVAISYYLLSNNIINWPFHRVKELSLAYMAILDYIPFFTLSLLSIMLLKISNIDIFENIRFNKNHKIVIIGFLASLGYSIYVLYPMRFGIYNYTFWPPVLILSILNAFAEEILFRLVLFQLLKKTINNFIISNLIQSLMYSILHFFIGGFIFGIMAFVYGFLLGLITEKSESIAPSIICHFIIDLGAIGAPLLVF